ncbi:hypothetical protein QUB56_31865 [Microcoleus sp. AR_TQ3_B6]|uniref:hypothetical protein n=1 Tax=Microcoleus sp. AR_TQ3_B6 TaxID=3055284 RepID=UPI002FD20C71
MARIKIHNLNCENQNRENQMVELDEKQLFNVLGGLESWHVYHAPDGTVIAREWENDGLNTLEHHYPTVH